MTNTIPQDDKASRKTFEVYYEKMYPNTDFTRYKPDSYAYKNDAIDEEWYLWDEAYQAALAHERQRNQSAKQKYDEIMVNEVETSPLERLRFFLSLALSGQDWLDVEPFINDLTKAQRNISVEAVQDNRPSGEEVYQCYYIVPEKGHYWGDCSKLVYDQIKTRKRIVFTAPPQAPSVREALAAAAKICDDIGDEHSRLKKEDALHNYIAGGADACAEKIRALIQDTKEG